MAVFAIWLHMHNHENVARDVVSDAFIAEDDEDQDANDESNPLAGLLPVLVASADCDSTAATTQWSNPQHVSRGARLQTNLHQEYIANCVINGVRIPHTHLSLIPN